MKSAGKKFKRYRKSGKERERARNQAQEEKTILKMRHPRW